MIAPTPLAANRMRWQRGRGHYEVWYATFSDPATRTGYWIRYTLEAPLAGHGEPYAQLWFARFDPADSTRTFGVNQRFPIESLSETDGPWSIRIGDCELRNEGMRGSFGNVSWDLAWPISTTTHLHLPSAIYGASFAETTVLSPNLDVRATGHVTVDGKRLDLEDVPLGQTHLWGRKHAYSWAWAHCNAFEGAHGAFEALTVRLRRGSLALPRLTMATLYLDGQAYAFREPWNFLANSAEYGTGRYAITATGLQHKIVAEFTSRADDMLMAEYVDPDGDASYCHNTECADARITLFERTLSGFREIASLRSDKKAHYEWGARAGDPLVKKRHREQTRNPSQN